MASTPTRPALPSAEKLLHDLIALPSVNPGAGGSQTAPYGEAAMVRYLADFLQPWADTVEVQEVLPGRPNLIARFSGKRKDLSFAFESHTDTVDVTGMTVAPFAAEVREGKVFGRGACDDKGPMVAQLLAILRHLEEGHSLPCEWFFLATCDEELGGKGAAHLAARAARAARAASGFRFDGIIVGEPTGNEPLIAHKGAVRFTLQVEGLAAHSAYPEQGANAIHAAADWITRLEATVAALDVNQADADARLTFSAGTFQGGDQVNRIPDRVEIQTDWRLPAGFDGKQIENLLHTTGTALKAVRPGIHCKWIKTQEYPPFAFTHSEPFAAALAPLFDSAASPHTARYATNAGFYAAAAIPALVFGPGSIAQAHRADEWIELSQIDLAIAKLRAVIEGIEQA